ncbi:MAG: diadenosine tetraphosphatase [Gammaproteobacteria bacterium BRH_c0]|nr:MAG: diadenosine tetraphosphatase [Gammaproteobacteria bacterium BRH_c0]
MAIYAVGDLQGCLSCLEKLLDNAGFQPGRDQLWAVGDLVNRGPSSLETLRFCKNLGSSFRTVLGNHDLHLLALARGHRSPSQKDTLQDILNAPDRDDLLEWLRHHPLVISEQGFTLVHAGIPPQWSIRKALKRAAEVETVLHSEQPGQLLSTMYGNQPDIWDKELEGADRWRVITNYFTRMRFCDRNGRLELQSKMGPATAPKGFAPWFSHSNRKANEDNIVFGHWAALNGTTRRSHLYPLDTGCVWGGRLRLLCLETKAYKHVSCKNIRNHSGAHLEHGS